MEAPCLPASYGDAARPRLWGAKAKRGAADCLWAVRASPATAPQGERVGMALPVALGQVQQLHRRRATLPQEVVDGRALQRHRQGLSVGEVGVPRLQRELELQPIHPQVRAPPPMVLLALGVTVQRRRGAPPLGPSGSPLSTPLGGGRPGSRIPAPATRPPAAKAWEPWDRGHRQPQVPRSASSTAASSSLGEKGFASSSMSVRRWAWARALCSAWPDMNRRRSPGRRWSATSAISGPVWR